MKELTTNFLNQHYYFSTVWPYLNSQKKEKISEIVSEGKGVIPYKMIIDMQSFFITPEKDFWEKTEFYGDLKHRYAIIFYNSQKRFLGKNRIL